MFAGLAEPLYRSGELPLKPLETVTLHGDRRTVFVGTSRNPNGEEWRRVGASIVRKMRKSKSIAFMGGDPARLAEGAVTGSLSVEVYRSNSNTPLLQKLVFVGGESNAIERGRVIGESVNWARRLIVEPSNLKPPRVMAEQARAMASEVGLDIKVLDEIAIRDLRMGAMLGVSQGSVEPPRIVVLKHRIRLRGMFWRWSGRASRSTPAGSA
jgi:leucyl aminopeptidase